MSYDFHRKDLQLAKSVLTSISLIKIQSLRCEAANIPLGEAAF